MLAPEANRARKPRLPVEKPPSLTEGTIRSPSTASGYAAMHASRQSTWSGPGPPPLPARSQREREHHPAPLPGDRVGPVRADRGAQRQQPVADHVATAAPTIPNAGMSTRLSATFAAAAPATVSAIWTVRAMTLSPVAVSVYAP